MLTREVQSCVEGTPGFEISRGVQDQEYMKRKTKRSASSAVDCGEFPEELIVQCIDENQRNTLLQLINSRIKYFKDIINQLFIPPDRGLDRYCDCFEAEYFEDEDDTTEKDTSA